MSSALPIPPVCPSCGTQINTQIPGAAGAPGAPGAAGTNGINAFTTVSAQFVMPALGANVNVSVTDTSQMVARQVVYVSTAGHMIVWTVINGTSVTLANPSTGAGVGNAYHLNAAPGTIIPAASEITPAGAEGPAGNVSGAAGGDLVGNYPNPTLAVLGAGAGPIGNATNVAAVTIDPKGRVTTLTAVAITFPAAPTTLPPNGAAGGDLTGNFPNPAFAAVGGGAIGPIGDALTIPVVTRDAKGRVTALTSIASNPRYALLGSKLAVDLNVATSDNAITLTSARYRLDKVTVENASVNLTVATAGVFTTAGGGGISVAADQVLSALNATTKFKDLTLAAAYAATTATDVLTAGTVYFRVGTPQGVAATANVWIWGWRLD